MTKGRKTRNKKVISMLLALILVIALVPTVSFAVDATFTLKGCGNLYDLLCIEIIK